jgi:hypothetical protein
MDPQAQQMSDAYRLGEQASVASQLYGSMLPFAAASTMANAQRAGSLLSPLTVFHGSPHKFSKFDASKIGTGEGAQVYGHGIYLAENPAVAKQYAENVKDMGSIKSINDELSRLSKIMSGDEIGYRKFKSDVGRKAAADYDELMAQRDALVKSQGSLYKADLPDEEIAKMLDWDKPLSQQPKAVQEALNKSEYALRDMAMDLYGRKDPLGSDIARAALKPQEFAKHMRELGIPGIRYLDQGSRGAGKGTSNFVVFPGEESKVRIMEINGKPVVIDEEELMRSGLLGQ